MLKYIVSVSYHKFVFTDSCAAMAYAEISKSTASEENTTVEIEIKNVPDESGSVDPDEEGR